MSSSIPLGNVTPPWESVSANGSVNTSSASDGGTKLNIIIFNDITWVP
jgi:hypothetical protein